METELKTVFDKLTTILEMIPVKQEKSFPIKAVNNGNIKCHGMLKTDCLQMDYLKMGKSVETIWMFQHRDVHFLIFRGSVNLHFRLNDTVHNKYLNTKQSLRIPMGIPFMLQTHEDPGQILLISIPDEAET